MEWKQYPEPWNGDSTPAEASDSFSVSLSVAHGEEPSGAGIVLP